MSGDTPALRVSGTVDLTDAKVTGPASEPLFAARGVHVAAAGLEPLRNAMHFDEIRLDRPVIDLSRDKQGVLNVEKLAGSPAAAPKPASAAANGASRAAAAAASTPAASGAQAGDTKTPPLDLTIRHVAIDGGTVNLDDRVPATPTALSLTKLAATLDGFALQRKTPAKYTLSTSLSRGGDLKAEGTVDVAAKQVDTKLVVDALALAPLQPYLGEATRARARRRARRDDQREGRLGQDAARRAGRRQRTEPEVVEARDARREGARDRAARRARRSRRSTWPRAPPRSRASTRTGSRST